MSRLPPRLGLLVLPLLGAGPGAGCSWVFVRPAPPPRSTAPLTCTTGRDAPVADASLAAFLWASTVTLLACPGKDCRSGLAWAAVAATAVGAIPAVLSSHFGFVETGRCREAWELREHWREAVQDPLAGARDHPCRPPGAAPCEPGLACVAERCVPPASRGGEGQPCLPVPGTRVEMCHGGLRCTDGRCVRLAP
jgi:hypothetical protein